MSTIASVTIDETRHLDAVVDRRVQLVLACGCRRDLALPLHVPTPRVGEPAKCWGGHQP